MLKISIVELRNQRRVVLEGKLIPPWTNELRNACDKASESLEGRELILDLNALTAISDQGENLLIALVNEGVKLRCRGVFTKKVLRQLVRRARAQRQT